MMDFLLTPTFLIDCAWQTTFFLALGLLMSCVWKSRSTRAHQILLWSICAALIAPILSQLPDSYKFKIFEAPAPLSTLNNPNHEEQFFSSNISSLEMEGNHAAATSNTSPIMTPVSTQTTIDSSTPIKSTEGMIWPAWNVLLGIEWLILSVLVFLRYLISLVFEARMLSDSELYKNSDMIRIVDKAASKLTLKTTMIVYQSKRLSSPVIWCWGKRPKLYIPCMPNKISDLESWESVFCHELAHLKRRDHWAELLGFLAVCLLPWQPLAWIAKTRLGRLSERACDDWVLASGHEPETYSEALYRMFTRQRVTFALPAVSSKNHLRSRIQYILENKCVNPQAGRFWKGMGLIVSILLIGAVSLATSNPTMRNVLLEANLSAMESEMPMSNARRIPIPEGVTVSNLSPDGKYFAVFYGNTLFTYNTKTNAMKYLKDYCYPYHALWSKDGSQVIYITSNDNWKSYNLVKQNINTKKIDTILELKNNTPQLEDWSPDGQYILATNAPDGMHIHPVESKETETIQINQIHPESSENISEELHPRFSPDSKFIVYKTSNNGSHALHIRNFAEKTFSSLTKFKGSIYDPFWAPDGKHILFRGSLNNQQFYLWSVPVDNGKFDGIPQICDYGAKFSITLTNNGFLAYSTTDNKPMRTLFALEMDQARGKPIGKPSMLLSAPQLIFAWDRKEDKLFIHTSEKMETVSMDGKKETLPYSKSLSQINCLSASTDGSYLYGIGRTNDDKGIFKLNYQTGQTEFLFSMENINQRFNNHSMLGLDNNTIVYNSDRKIFTLNLQKLANYEFFDKEANKELAYSGDYQEGIDYN